MRKLVALVAAIAMLLTMVAVPATAEGTDWNSKEKLTITWTTYFTAPSSEDAWTIRNIEEKFNVDIILDPIEDSNFNEVLNARIMGGQTPDVIRLKDPGQLQSYIEQDVIGTIDLDVLRANAPMICAAIDGFRDGTYWAYGSADGQQYAIPAIAAGNMYHLPVVYNETWLKKVGKEIPTTLDELHEVLKAFTFEDPDGNGQNDTYGMSSDGMRQIFGAYGVNPGAPDGRTDHSFIQLIDGKPAYAATSEQYKEALKVIRDWYAEGIIDPEFITGENTGGYWAISHSMVNHRIGMTVRANYYHWIMPGAYEVKAPDGSLVPCDPGAVAKEFVAVNPDESVVMAQPVTGPNGDRGVKMWDLLAQFYCFSKDATQNPEKWERICAIMEYMDRQYSLDQEVLEQYFKDVYGEEGKYWYWADKDNCVISINSENFEKDYPADSPVDEFGFLQWGPELPLPRNDDYGKFAKGLGYLEGGISNLVQFSLPAMANYQSNLTNIKDQWMVKFITGKADIDADWDAYVKELNVNGLEEMMDEINDWYESTQK